MECWFKWVHLYILQPVIVCKMSPFYILLQQLFLTKIIKLKILEKSTTALNSHIAGHEIKFLFAFFNVHVCVCVRAWSQIYWNIINPRNVKFTFIYWCIALVTIYIPRNRWPRAVTQLLDNISSYYSVPTFILSK